MRFEKTITIKVSGEAESGEQFDRDMHDYLDTIRDMAAVYEESDCTVQVIAPLAAEVVKHEPWCESISKECDCGASR